MTEDDLPIFFEHQRDPDANRMAAFPARDRDAFMAHWGRILANPAALVQTILVGAQVVGHVGSWETDGRRLVGYWIGKEWWGRGVASAGLAAFLERVPVRPLYAHVAKENIGSIRVLEKCGFALCIGLTEMLPAPSDGVEELVFGLGAAGCRASDGSQQPAGPEGGGATDFGRRGRSSPQGGS